LPDLETRGKRNLVFRSFEIHPKPEQWATHQNYAKMLRPELEVVEGFVDNIRSKSLTREGWILSLSNWKDENSVGRWRTKMRHHEVQERGRGEVLADYHLRVGLITLEEQRLDETEVGEGTTVTLIDAKRPSDWQRTNNPANRAEWLSWDVFDTVLTPGDLILILNWKDNAMAEDFEGSAELPEGARIRGVRIVRDYGMYDRREEPQHYPDAANRMTIHSLRLSMNTEPTANDAKAKFKILLTTSLVSSLIVLDTNTPRVGRSRWSSERLPGPPAAARTLILTRP
jgi:heme-degrading monooxygenase HmoA